jgi:hypothetical protein
MLKHEESSIKVYFSKEYGLFRMISGNRELDAAKIRRIKNDISHGIDVLRYCPILVKQNKDEKLEIVDGQHRFWVAKELKKPVHYIIVEHIDLYGIAKINSNTEKWKAKDFINAYAQNGNKDYITLRKFIEDNGLPVTTAINLLAQGFEGAADGGKYRDAFQIGRFTVNKLEEAETIIEVCKRFSKSLVWKDRGFITAIAKIIQSGKCDIEDLVEKFEKNPELLEKQLSYKEYLVNLETIYNVRMRHRRVIY